MRLRYYLLIASLLLFAGLPASAQLPAGECAVGPGLGASLLFPYFESDLNSFSGPATLLSVHNAFNTPTLVRFVFWTNLGFPTLAFDAYLPAFALTSINVRDVLNGTIPSTGEGEDLSAFGMCDTNPPFHSNPALTSNEVAQFRADHTGQSGPLFPTECVGGEITDGIARGYITVDVVDQCSGIEAGVVDVSPVSRNYFTDGDGSGVALNENRLWGDIFYVSEDTASAHGSTAVTLWADADLFSGNDVYTFYGKYSNWDGRDNRVPLPYAWDMRFFNGGPFAGGASLIVYHDSGALPQVFACGADPVGFPLTGTLGARDGEGQQPVDLTPEFDTVAGLVTQRGSVSDLSIPYPFGWLQATSTSNGRQSWIQPTLSASGLYSASLDATPILFSCDLTPSTSAAPLAPGDGPMSTSPESSPLVAPAWLHRTRAKN